MMIVLSLAAALIGGIVFRKLKVPAGLLVGAIFAVALLNITTGQAYIWPQVRVVSQILTGAYIGDMMTKSRIMLLPKVIGPFAVVIGSFMVLNLLVGSFIYKVTDLDLLTALFCAMPGGLTDTILVAMDMGVNVPVVTVMQFVRMIFGIGCLPTIIKFSGRFLGNDGAGEKATVSAAAKSTQRLHVSDLIRFLPTLLIAAVAGLAGKQVGIPAGVLVFSMAVVAGLNIAGKTPPLPIQLRQLAQVLCGCCIGASIQAEHLAQLPQLILPAVTLCVGYMVCCVGMGYLVSRKFKINPCESMLYLSPAGATEMALIAADLGIESTNLVLLQICRLVCVMSIFP